MSSGYPTASHRATAAPSPALALAAAAGDDTAARDRFIARAAATGDGVAVIATHLKLSRQQVHAIIDRQRQIPGPDPRGAPPSPEEVSAWDATESALEAMTSGEDFERLVQVLLGDIDSAIRPLGGVGDRARDAVADLAGGDGSVYSISLEREWTRKIRREVARILDFGYRPAFVYAVTNRRTTRAAERKLEDWARARGITLRVLGQRWLVVKLLHPSYLELRREMLHLTPPRPNVFLDPRAYRELLNGRPANQGLDIPRVGGPSIPETVRARLRDRPGVVLYGSGGIGKTRLVLDLADQAPAGEQWRFLDDLTPIRDDALGELGSGYELVVVIDNAHRRRDLAEVLALLERRRPRPKVVFVVRPIRVETVDQLVRGVWLGPLGDEDYIRVRGLTNYEVVALSKGPPFNLTYDGMIRAIVQLAEGNPLVAILAAGLARDGQSIVELSRAEVFAEYVSGLLGSLTDRSAEPRQLRELLAIVSALGALGRGDQPAFQIAADLLGFAPRAVRRWLEELADLGLVVEDQRGVATIKPDLLAEHVLVSSFFSRRWPAEFAYEEVLAAFAPEYLRSLCAALGRVPPGELDPQHSGLQALRNLLLPTLRTGDIQLAAQLLRLLLPGGEALILPDLECLIARVEENPSTLSVEAGKTLVEATQFVNGDVASGWQLLLRLTAAASDPGVLDDARGAMQSIYQRVPTATSQHDGWILGMVQQVIAKATRSYARRARTAGELRAAATAGQALLTTTFEHTQTSVEDARQINLRAFALPATPSTESALEVGLDTIIATFLRVDDAERVRDIESATELARRAAGFAGPFGIQLSEEARHMAHRLLEKFDGFLHEHLEDLTLPVQAEAFGYLLTRREWLQRTPAGSEPPEEAPPSLPSRSPDLDEYLLLIHPKDIEAPSDRRSWEEEQQAKQAQASQIAQRLTLDRNWRDRLARWERWSEEGARLSDRAGAPRWVIVVLTEVARLQPQRAIEIIDELIPTESELRLLLPGAIHQLVAAAEVDELTLRRWLETDEYVRAMVATAIADVDSELAIQTFRGLARDTSEIVRRGVLNGLRYGTATSEWKIELGLNIARDLADIDALQSVLMVAEIGAVPITRHLATLGQDALLASATVERVDEYDLIDVLRRLEPEAPDLALAWTWRRIDWLETQTTRAWMLDALPNGLATHIREHAGAHDLQTALRRFQQVDAGSAAAAALIDLLNWIDPAAPEITEFIVQNYDDPDQERHAHRLLSLKLSWAECRERAAVLADELDDDTAVLGLVDNMLPYSWSGSRIPHLENAVQRITDWDQASASPAFRSAIAVAIANLKRWIEVEKERDRREDDLELWG